MTYVQQQSVAQFQADSADTQRHTERRDGDKYSTNLNRPKLRAVF